MKFPTFSLAYADGDPRDRWPHGIIPGELYAVDVETDDRALRVIVSPACGAAVNNPAVLLDAVIEALRRHAGGGDAMVSAGRPVPRIVVDFVPATSREAQPC